MWKSFLRPGKHPETSSCAWHCQRAVRLINLGRSYAPVGHFHLLPPDRTSTSLPQQSRDCLRSQPGPWSEPLMASSWRTILPPESALSRSFRISATSLDSISFFLSFFFLRGAHPSATGALTKVSPVVTAVATAAAAAALGYWREPRVFP